MANAHLRLVAPIPVFGIVATPRRKPNAALRPREYLTEAEVERLRRATRAGNRNGHRDETMILIAFRHGLRASELVTLRWDAIDLEQGKLHCNRRKMPCSEIIFRDYQAALGACMVTGRLLPVRKTYDGEK